MRRSRGLSRRLIARSTSLRRAYEQSRFQTRLQGRPAAAELLLSPHWDDAVLDCWGLLASERPLHVVNVFAGVPAAGGVAPWDAITGAADSSQRARERIAEDARALERAGRKPRNLPFLDAQYRRAGSNPSLAELDRALSAELASVARVYVPAAIGAHPDHLLTRRYGRMLARAGIPVSLYADLPYCVRHGWPHWVDGGAPGAHRDVDAFWLSYLRDVPEAGPLRGAHVERLDDAAAAAKLAAMSCYATQLPALEYGGRPFLADPEIHRFELRWELRPARA